MGHGSRHPSFSSTASMVMVNYSDLPNGQTNNIPMNNNVDRNKPLPTATANQQSQLPPLMPQATAEAQVTSERGFRRRRSFMPAALKTSGLAKLVGGNNHAVSPTSMGQHSPRSPRSPIQTPKQADQKEEDLVRMERPLSIEHFKWVIVRCCNEIKTRGTLARQRYESSKSPTPTSADAMGAPLSATTAQPPRKAEKSKGRFNSMSSSSAAQADSTLSKDPRATLHSLLQVMAVSNGTEENKAYASQDASAGGFYMGAPLPSHSPLPSLSHNPSLLSLMGMSRGAGTGANGVGGGDSGFMTAGPALGESTAPTPMRSRPVNQLTHHPASFRSMAPSVAPSNTTGTTSHHSHHPHYYPQQPQQQQPLPQRMKSVKSSSADGILKPLSLEDLVRLLTFTLSVAPDQWIPSHMYDFLERKGQRYTDMIGLLPTHCRKILKPLLEAVDGLVDCAVAAEIAQRDQPSPTATKFGSLSSTTGFLSRRARNESIASANNTLNGILPPTSNNNNNSGNSQQDIRSRKRRTILDSLSCLVFRSAIDPSTGMYPNGGDSPSERDGMSASKVPEERGKNKRASATSSNGFPPSSVAAAVAGAIIGAISGGSGAGAAATLPGTSMIGLKASETLMTAFEEEQHQRLSAFNRVSDIAGVSGTTAFNPSDAHMASPHFERPVSMPSAGPGQAMSVAGAAQQGPIPPRLARSLPNGSSPSSTAMEPTTVRSLSLPPWRKQVIAVSNSTKNLIRPGHNLESVHRNVKTSSPSNPSSSSTTTGPTAGAAKNSSMNPRTFLKASGPSSESKQSQQPPQPQRSLHRPSLSSSSAPPSTNASASRTVENTRPTSELPRRSRLKSEPTPPSQPLVPPSQLPPLARTRERRVSSTLSSTWSAWKDHLLILEEEEQLVEDGSGDE